MKSNYFKAQMGPSYITACLLFNHMFGTLTVPVNRYWLNGCPQPGAVPSPGATEPNEPDTVASIAGFTVEQGSPAVEPAAA